MNVNWPVRRSRSYEPGKRIKSAEAIASAQHDQVKLVSEISNRLVPPGTKLVLERSCLKPRALRVRFGTVVECAAVIGRAPVALIKE